MHECICMKLSFAYSRACAPQYCATQGRGPPIHLFRHVLASSVFAVLGDRPSGISSQQPLLYISLVWNGPIQLCLYWQTPLLSRIKVVQLLRPSGVLPAQYTCNTASTKPITINTALIRANAGSIILFRESTPQSYSYGVQPRIPNKRGREEEVENAQERGRRESKMGKRTEP